MSLWRITRRSFGRRELILPNDLIGDERMVRVEARGDNDVLHVAFRSTDDEREMARVLMAMLSKYDKVPEIAPGVVYDYMSGVEDPEPFIALMTGIPWRGIATAPKDGTVIWGAWRSFDPNVRYHVGKIEFRTKWWWPLVGREYTGWGVVDSGPPAKEPDYWAPLSDDEPAPPT